MTTEVQSDGAPTEPREEATATESTPAAEATPSEPTANAEMAAASEATDSGSGETPAADAAADPAPARAGWAAWMGTLGTGVGAAVPASRSTWLAGGVGFAAGIALLAGAGGVMGAGHLFAAPTSANAAWSEAAGEARALKQTVTRLEAQLAELKASINAASRQAKAQHAQSAERDQRQAGLQSEVQTRLTKIDDSIERLEKRVAAAAATEITGSVAPRYAAAAAAARQKPSTEAKAAPQPPVARGWVIRDVFRGRALVEGRFGVFEAAPGLRLPRLGRVEAVKRQDGDWVVVTEKGIIKDMRHPRSADGRH